MPLDSVDSALSPSWWVKRLYKQLMTRRGEVEFFNSYYIGDHPLPWLAPQAHADFRRILAMTRSNYMGLVCDAVAERVGVEGFRFGPDATADMDTWDIYQANNLDKDSDLAWLESLVGSVSYFLVAPNAEDTKRPHIWVEHASQAIVEHVPGTNRRQRKAALKVWDDDWTNQIHATLYLSEGSRLWLYKYVAEKSKDAVTVHSPDWKARRPRGEAWPANGGMDVVPMIEVPNNPRLLTGGVSELFDLTDIQDRINKTLADRLITQDYGAFPQKWATAWPETDELGNPTPPIAIGRNRMLTTEVAETEFGQFDTAPLDPYSAAKREDVKDIASRSRTPAQYLLGELNNVNGETLKASESGLVSKVKQRRRPWGEALEETMRLARSLAGFSSPGDPSMEVIWSNPEYRTEGELVDATVKKVQSRLASLRQGREDVGYTQTQIRRLETEDRDETLSIVEPAILRALRPDGNAAPAGV